MCSGCGTRGSTSNIRPPRRPASRSITSRSSRARPPVCGRRPRGMWLRLPAIADRAVLKNCGGTTASTARRAPGGPRSSTGNIRTRLSCASREGSFYPRAAALTFADWVLEEGVWGISKPPSRSKSYHIKARPSRLCGRFVTNRDLGYQNVRRERVQGAAAKTTAPATTDAALFARIIQLRLGRDFEKCPAPCGVQEVELRRVHASSCGPRSSSNAAQARARQARAPRSAIPDP